VQSFRIPKLVKADEALLLNDVFLVLLHANRIPPHLLVSVNGKIFTLSVKGTTVDGEMAALLTLIRKKNIETIFIRLSLPPFFTTEDLKAIMRKCILAYPRVDVGLATCLTPISDFCQSVYDVEKKNVNLIFDLLPGLQEHAAIREYYHLNLDRYLAGDSFSIRKYSVNDVYEAIRQPSLIG